MERERIEMHGLGRVADRMEQEWIEWDRIEVRGLGRVADRMEQEWIETGPAASGPTAKLV